MPRADVVVVGAGAAGLGTAAALRERRLRPVVLERDDEVGARWARRYERLCLHTVKRFSGLPYRRLPRTYPRYVPKDLYARYLAEYALAHELDVRLGEPVERIEPGWVVRAHTDEWRTDAVVVATGRYNVPRLPAWEGAAEFEGRVLHSVDYRSGRDFAGERVLVVGIGNTGAEIATDLVEQGAEHVAIAVRRTPPITRREIAGVPVQLFGLAAAGLPGRAVDRVAKVLRRIGTGDLRPYGLGEEEWGPFESRRPPVIDVGFLAQLKARRVVVRPDVDRLTPTGVVFADGSEEAFDSVVAATGFATGLDELLDGAAQLDALGLPRDPPPGLFFAGFAESLRGALFETKREAPRIAEAVARHLERAGVPAAAPRSF